MIKYGGNIVDAYGIVNVISPAGLPIRGIVGISPDPIMFVAVNSVDIEKSTEFYNRLGFVEQVRPTSLLLSLLSRAPLIRFLPGVSVLPTKQGTGSNRARATKGVRLPGPITQFHGSAVVESSQENKVLDPEPRYTVVELCLLPKIGNFRCDGPRQ